MSASSSSSVSSREPTYNVQIDNKASQKKRKLGPAENRVVETATPVISSAVSSGTVTRSQDQNSPKPLTNDRFDKFIKMKLDGLPNPNDEDIVTRVKQKVNDDVLKMINDKNVEHFEALVLIDKGIRSATYEVQMERIDGYLESLKNLAKTSTELMSQIYTLTISEQIEFKSKLEAYDAEFNRLNDKINFLTNSVHKNISDLNTLIGSASDEQKELRNQFTSKWNQVCLQKYSLKWHLSFMQAAYSFPPVLRNYLNTLNENVKQTHDKKNSGINTPNKTEDQWVELKNYLSEKQKLFDSTQVDLIKMQQDLEKFLPQLNKEKFKKEYLEGFAVKSEELEKNVTSALEKEIQQVNRKREELWANITTDWKSICNSNQEFATQIDHFSSVNYLGFNPLKSIVNLWTTFSRNYTVVKVTNKSYPLPQ